jgi:hypothetical protein
MEPAATRFPFPLPPRTIGEQKAKVKSISDLANDKMTFLHLAV